MKFFDTIAGGTVDVTRLAFTVLHFGALSHFGTTDDFRNDTASRPSVLGSGGTTSITVAHP